MTTKAEDEPILTTEGFHKLRPGRIHLFCGRCGRKLSNMPKFKGWPNGTPGGERETADPKTAAYAVITCCADSGDKAEEDPIYFTKRLKLVRNPFQLENDR